LGPGAHQPPAGAKCRRRRPPQLSRHHPPRAPPPIARCRVSRPRLATRQLPIIRGHASRPGAAAFVYRGHASRLGTAAFVYRGRASRLGTAAYQPMCSNNTSVCRAIEGAVPWLLLVHEAGTAVPLHHWARAVVHRSTSERACPHTITPTHPRAIAPRCSHNPPSSRSNVPCRCITLPGPIVPTHHVPDTSTHAHTCTHTHDVSSTQTPFTSCVPHHDACRVTCTHWHTTYVHHDAHALAQPLRTAAVLPHGHTVSTPSIYAVSLFRGPRHSFTSL
jgi:hypothetical protein